MLSAAGAKRQMPILAFKEEIFISCYHEARAQNSDHPPTYTQLQKVFEARGFTVTTESLKTCHKKINVKRKKNRKKRFVVLKRRLRSGIYDQDILKAHASFVIEYGRNPVSKELCAYLLKDRPNCFITCMTFQNRIKDLRELGHNLPLRGNEKISSDIVKDIFCKLRREKGKNPFLKTLRAELLAVYPHISITTDALSRRLVSIRKKLPHSRRHLFVPGGKNITLPFTAIHKAYDELLRDRRNNKTLPPPSKVALMRKLAPRSVEKRVGLWQKHVNHTRAQEGKYPLLFPGELACYDLLVLRSYKDMLMEEINGITAMSALMNKLGIRYAPCSLQRMKKESRLARLPELPVPFGYIKIEELRKKNVVPLINLYVLWTMSRAVLDMKTLVVADNHAHQKEKTLYERFTPKNRHDDNQFLGKIYVLSLAMLSGYLKRESLQGLIYWLDNECPNLNSAVSAIDEKISSIVGRAESLK